MMGHPSAPVLSAALAAGELGLATGQDLVHAFLLGFEVETTVAEVINPAHYEHGWHATCTLGTLGAAAAAARILGLDTAQTATALAVAASQASGLKENFGTMTKPFHAGHAARSGVLAALLAREGWTASAQALEGPQGYLQVFSAGRRELGALDTLGRRGRSRPPASPSSRSRRAPARTRSSTGRSSSDAPMRSGPSRSPRSPSA